MQWKWSCTSCLKGKEGRRGKECKKFPLALYLHWLEEKKENPLFNSGQRPWGKGRSAVITSESGTISWAWDWDILFTFSLMNGFICQAAGPENFRIFWNFLLFSWRFVVQPERLTQVWLRWFSGSTLDHFYLGYFGSQFPGDFRQLKICFFLLFPFFFYLLFLFFSILVWAIMEVFHFSLPSSFG